MVMGTHYFYIIWLPLRKQQYAVVLQWLRCRQGQGLKAKAKGTTPNAKASGVTEQRGPLTDLGLGTPPLDPNQLKWK